MLERIGKLRNAVVLTQVQLRFKEEECLDDDDFEVIEIVTMILKPFFELTKRFSSNKVIMTYFW